MSPLASDEENEREILGDYFQGVLSRSEAMHRLGIEWYDDLLQKMNALGIKRPLLKPDDIIEMKRSVDNFFSTNGKL